MDFITAVKSGAHDCEVVEKDPTGRYVRVRTILDFKLNVYLEEKYTVCCSNFQ